MPWCYLVGRVVKGRTPNVSDRSSSNFILRAQLTGSEFKTGHYAWSPFRQPGIVAIAVGDDIQGL